MLLLLIHVMIVFMFKKELYLLWTIIRVGYHKLLLSYIDMIVLSICCIYLFLLEWTNLWLHLSFHFLNTFSDPWVWPLIEKNRIRSVLKSSKLCVCGPIVDRKLYKPTTPPSSNTDAQMACLMISILTGCQYIFYYSKAWDWNWESRVACFYTSY